MSLLEILSHFTLNQLLNYDLYICFISASSSVVMLCEYLRWEQNSVILYIRRSAEIWNVVVWIMKPCSLAPISSQSHIATDGQSISNSLCRAPSGAHDQIFIALWPLQSCFYGASSLTRGRVCLLYVLMVLASIVFLGSESLETHHHIFLSQIWGFLFVASYDLYPFTTLQSIIAQKTAVYTMMSFRIVLFVPHVDCCAVHVILLWKRFDWLSANETWCHW
jgi:hypothetical protein